MEIRNDFPPLSGLFRKKRSAAGPFSSALQLQVTEDRRVIVTGHRGITRAGSGCFGFACRGFGLEISGKDLCVEVSTATEAIVSGRIENVAFRRMGGAK